MSADTSLDEERRIAEKASAVLSSLGPLSPRNAEKLSVLNKAIFTATNKASLNLYSRDEALSPARREAAAALNVIYELLGRGRLPLATLLAPPAHLTSAGPWWWRRHCRPDRERRPPWQRPSVLKSPNRHFPQNRERLLIRNRIPGGQLQTGEGARPVASTTRRNDCRHHEGDRVAAAFGPRVLRRRGAQEARSAAFVAED